ncbi:MAG: hypothetical protein ACRDOI_08650 [Trebonia sp.]
MEITSEYVAALRSCLTGEGDYTELSARLQARDGGERSARIYGVLSVMALHLAAKRRFPGGHTDADVIRLVGRTRATFGEGYEIDPLVAEATLRGALGDTAATANMNGPEMGTALFPLLIVLLEQEGITTARIDDFLADALPLAEAWLTREQSASTSDT